jgi:hypothetical protein
MSERSIPTKLLVTPLQSALSDDYRYSCELEVPARKTCAAVQAQGRIETIKTAPIPSAPPIAL